MARYNRRLHCIVGVLPTCYKRKAATYFYPPGGTGPNYEETLLLLKDYEPPALCLQETHLKDLDNISIRNYTAFHTFSTNNERAAGGVSIFVNK